MRPLVWLPVAMLGVLAGWAGLRARLPDEGAAIRRAAAAYVAQVPGGRAEDCAGRPGQGAAWIVVACAVGRPEARIYRLDRSGRALDGADGPDGF